MRVFSFPRGGLTFEDPTVPSRNSSVIAFLPALSVIPLVQHSDESVTSLVSIGDTVTEGMLIGKAKNQNSVNVHAAVPGKIIDNVEWNDADGKKNKGLVIRLQGAFERLGRKEKNFLGNGMNRQELQQILTDCGIVEMEGSGKPVADILSALKAEKKPLTLVVRCVFDDPWLAADYVLCKERLKEVVEGSFIIAKVGGRIGRVVFAVSYREKSLGETMLAEAQQYDIPSTLVLTGSKYPQRNRRELELALRNYEKKEGYDFGSFLILGPATLAAVHDAAKFHRPILERYVAVGGSAVRKPQVMRVRIGKRLSDIFNECGGFIDTPCRIAVGSPLSGKTVTTLNEPVTKTSYAIFAMLKSQAGDFPQRDCISCGECRSVCPVGLDPEELYKQITILRLKRSAMEECHGCGCCEVVCPSCLPLSDVITGKIAEDITSDGGAGAQ
ncbi:MAG: 4Fe-4S dicluster domain-containing protein [Treponema sp.]|nr:4Fe-4S dicluster domain-containing protein [Treponema sp.]